MSVAHPAPSSRFLLLIALVWAAIWFSNLEYRKLVRPDEGRYAEIPREMAVTGDWVTPRLNGIKYFEKPPLQYWATAAAYDAFGTSHWTARLWPALTGFLALIAVWFTGSRLHGHAAGLFVAVVLGSCSWWVLLGHILTLDMGLAFFMTLILCGFLLAQHDHATDAERRLWMHVAWAAAAGALLSKGLVGVVLPGMVFVLYLLVTRDWRLLGRLHLATGLLLFAVLALPWFLAVQRANPEFFEFFFIHEHFNRFLTKVHRRTAPWWYFAPMLVVGLMPWLTLLFARTRRAHEPDGRFRPKVFLAIWAVFIVLFFSMSSSKLPAYILPVFPAIALLLGERLIRVDPASFGRHALFLAVAGAAVAALAPQVVRFASEVSPEALYRGYVPWIAAAGIALLAGAIGARMLIGRGRAVGAVVVLGLGGLTMTQLALTGHEALSPSQSAWLLVQRAKPALRSDAPFYSVGTYEQTLPFYIGRTVTQVAFLDELAFGIQQEPHLWVPTLAAFEHRWRTHDHAFAIMNPDTYDQLKHAKLPMKEVARDTRRVIVSKP